MADEQKPGGSEAAPPPGSEAAGQPEKPAAEACIKTGQGADGVEGDALGFHYLPVIRGGGDGDRVAAALEFEAECEAGMQIAERPDGGEEDSLRLVLVRQSGLPGSASTWIIRCGGCRGHGPL